MNSLLNSYTCEWKFLRKIVHINTISNNQHTANYKKEHRRNNQHMANYKKEYRNNQLNVQLLNTL